MFHLNLFSFLAPFYVVFGLSTKTASEDQNNLTDDGQIRDSVGIVWVHCSTDHHQLHLHNHHHHHPGHP